MIEIGLNFNNFFITLVDWFHSSLIISFFESLSNFLNKNLNNFENPLPKLELFLGFFANGAGRTSSTGVATVAADHAFRRRLGPWPRRAGRTFTPLSRRARFGWAARRSRRGVEGTIVNLRRISAYRDDLNLIYVAVAS